MATKRSDKKSLKRKSREEEEQQKDIETSDDDLIKETVVKKPVKKKRKDKTKKRKSSSSDEEDTAPSPKRRQVLASVSEGVSEDVPVGHDEGQDEDEQPMIVKPKTLKFPLTTAHKPVRHHGWLYHIAAVAISSCLKHSQEQSIDLRKAGDTDDINWSQICKKSFTSSDIQKLWYYIGKQYPDEPVSDILKSLSSFTSVGLLKTQYHDAMPKKPKTSFMIFYHKKRAEIAKKYPDLSNALIAKKLGELWKEMSSKKKSKYDRQYQTYKETYTEQMKQFYLEHPDMTPTSTKTSKDKSLSNGDIEDLTSNGNIIELKKIAPKKPIGAYLIFCKEKRTLTGKKYPDLTPILVTKKLGEMWQSLSDTEKSKYVSLNETDKERYEEEVAKFWISYPQAAALLKFKKPANQTIKPKEKIISESTCSTSSSSEENEDNEEESD